MPYSTVATASCLGGAWLLESPKTATPTPNTSKSQPVSPVSPAKKKESRA